MEKLARFLRLFQKEISLYFLFVVVVFFALFRLNEVTFLGGDWGLPLTETQVSVSLINTFYPFGNDFFQTFNSMKNSDYFYVFYYVAWFMFQESAALAFLIVLFTLAGWSMVYMLRYVGFSKFPSFFGGLFYVFSPAFFNYTLMGWTFVLLVLGLFPLIFVFFDKAFRTNQVRFTLLVGLFYALAIWQSQSLIWVPVLLVLQSIYLVKSVRDVFRFAAHLSIVVFVMLLFHAYWWPLVLFFPDARSMGSELVLSSGSTGTSAKLSFINLLRLWGGLFNYQFENYYPKVLEAVSFIPIIFVSFSLWGAKNKKILVFLCYFLIPFGLYLLPREVLVFIPFSGIIRDFGRFLVFSTFAFGFFSALFVSIYVKSFYTKSILVLVFVLYSHPFWLNHMVQMPEGVKSEESFNFRRLESLEDLNSLENALVQQVMADKVYGKVFYMPFGGYLGLLGQKSYFGPYKEVADIWAGYSVLPGNISVNDRKLLVGENLTTQFIRKIEQADWQSLKLLFELNSIKYVVLRTTSWQDYWSINNLATHLKKEKSLIEVFSNSQGVVYAFMKARPLIYSPDLIYYTNDVNSYYSSIVQGKTKDLIAFSYDLPGSNDHPVFNVYFPKKGEKDLLHNERWHSGWVWPQVRREPGSLVYSLVRLKERIDLRFSADTQTRVEKLIWFSAKRAQEISAFGLNDEQRDEVFNNYIITNKEILSILRSVMKSNQSQEFLDVANKYNIFFVRSLSVVEESLNSEQSEKLDEFSSEYFAWYLSISETYCKYLCYELFVPADGEYRVMVGEEFLQMLENDYVSLVDYENGTKRKIQLDEWTYFDEGTYLVEMEFVYTENQLSEDWIIPISAAKDVFGVSVDQEFASPKTFGFGDKLPADFLAYTRFTEYEPRTTYHVQVDYEFSEPLNKAILDPKIEIYERYIAYSYDENKKSRPDYDFSKKISERLIEGKNVVCEENICTGTLDFEFDSSGKADMAVLGLVVDDKAYGSRGNLRIIEARVFAEPKPPLYLLNRTFEQSSPLSDLPKITFREVSPSEFDVRVINATKPYALIFNKGFHKGWDLQTVQGKSLNKQNYMANDFANMWYIEPSDFENQPIYDLKIIFRPQKMYDYGRIVSLVSTLGFVSYVLYATFKTRIKK